MPAAFYFKAIAGLDAYGIINAIAYGNGTFVIGGSKGFGNINNSVMAYSTGF
jgi:hypothetical protein